MVKYMNNNNSGFNMWNANKNATQPSKASSRIGGMLWWFIMLIAAWLIIGWWVSPTPSTDFVDTNVDAIDLTNVPVYQVSSNKLSASVQGLRIHDVKLSDFAASAKDLNGARVSLLGAAGDYAEVGYIATGVAAPGVDVKWRGTPDKMTWRDASGVQFTRSIFIEDYVIIVTDEIKNNSKVPATFAPYARIVRGAADKSSAGVKTGAVSFINSDVEYRDWRKLENKSYAYSTINGFTGFADQYWETIASISRPDQTIRVKGAGDKFVADAAAGAVTIAPGAKDTIITNIYTGPRSQDALSAAAQHIAGIDETMDYGWFWFLARPMLWLINMFNSFVHNYGIAIILMTVLLRLILWPVTRKSYTSMMAMQKMQPEMARIQKLYANDKPRMQMEMMRLYQTHKTSPMSGCLPMLIQIPIFFALYKALLVSVQMRSAHFLWISDLAAMDPYFILPILMGATMWLQQYLQSASSNKNAGNDPVAQTQKAMKWMPVLFTVMFAWMPAGLVLYWTVSNILAIAQMYIIKMRTAK